MSAHALVGSTFVVVLHYALTYGPNCSSIDPEKLAQLEADKAKKAEKRKRQKNKNKWKAKENHANVYVLNSCSLGSTSC